MNKRVIAGFLAISLLINTATDAWALRSKTAQKGLLTVAGLTSIGAYIGHYLLARKVMGKRAATGSSSSSSSTVVVENFDDVPQVEIFSIQRAIRSLLVTAVVAGIPLAISYFVDCTVDAEYKTLNKEVERLASNELIATIHTKESLQKHVAERYINYAPRAGLIVAKGDYALAAEQIKASLARIEKIRTKIADDAEFVVACDQSVLVLNRLLANTHANNKLINQLLS